MAYDGKQCLTDDQVVNYVEERYPEEREKIAEHESACGRCAGRISDEREFQNRGQQSAIRNDDLRDELDERYPGWRG
jgi:hypothetical protein